MEKGGDLSPSENEPANFCLGLPRCLSGIWKNLSGATTRINWLPTFHCSGLFFLLLSCGKSTGVGFSFKNPGQYWRRKREKKILFFLKLTPEFLRKNYDRNFSQKVFEMVKISSEFASKWLCGVNRVTKLSDGLSQKIWPKGLVVGGICKKCQSPHSREPFRKNLRSAPIPPMRPRA